MIHAEQTKNPACPVCGCCAFTLEVPQLFDVVFFGDGDHSIADGPRGDTEWGDKTEAICRECGHCAPLGEMTGVPQ